MLIKNKKVGYVPTDHAPKVVAFLRKQGARHDMCSAKIRGGWKREVQEGIEAIEGGFGVLLNLSWPPKLHPDQT